MGDKSGPSNVGAVVSVRGSVVDIRFDAHLPAIYSLLHAKKGKIAIEVLAQLDAHCVRGIKLTPTRGLACDGYNASMERYKHDITILIASDMLEEKSSLPKSEA